MIGGVLTMIHRHEQITVMSYAEEKKGQIPQIWTSLLYLTNSNEASVAESCKQW